MIFALADLLRYRCRLGQYGDDPSKNVLALGHTHHVAEETLKLLAPGDFVICQRMNSLLSWAIMYFGGRYAVDHVAVYIGDGKVLHQTLSGVKEHSIHTLARGARVLPFRPYGLDESDAGFNQPQPSIVQGGRASHVGEAQPDEAAVEGHHEAILPPHLQLLLAGIQITLGLRPTSFRWQYYFDLGMLATLLDLLLWPLNQFPMACTIWIVWLLVLIWMRIRFHIQLRLGRDFERDSHPGLTILLMWNRGGYIFPYKPLNGRWKVRVLPEWLVPFSLQRIALLSPSQQSSQENSASDQ
jgi:hypothetical protein